MNRCLALCGYNMRNTASRRPLLPHFERPRTAMAATLAACLAWVLLLPDTAHALDPNKRLTQYLHTSWRIQDGSAPSGIYTVAQTSDGFLWFSTYSPTIYRFDGVRFLPRHFPYKGAPGNKVFKVFGARAGGLWTVGSREIAYINDGAVASDFQLDGFSSFQNVSEDPDGSLWVVRAAANISDSALCHITQTAFKCSGQVITEAVQLPGLTAGEREELQQAGVRNVGGAAGA
jgi:ligand-binding sensor domain-containing protein